MIYQEGPSGNRNHPERKLKLLLFCILFPVIVVVLLWLRSPDPLEDFSGGRYAETFQTKYKPLQKELILLNKEGFFLQPEDPRLVPSVFSVWYHSPETEQIISKEKISLRSYENTIRSCLEKAQQKKEIFFADPLENPVPGDLFRTLEYCFEWHLNRDDPERSITALEHLFSFTSILLNSNAPDSYFAEHSVRCARKFEQRFSDRKNALASWAENRMKLPGKYVFPYRNLYALDRLRSMRDFEKIRLNGIHLYDGKSLPSTQIKDGLKNFSPGEILEAVETEIVDFFYDADRDQALNLSIYREILHNGATPKTVSWPDRKMSIRSMRRLTRDEDILTSLLMYLGKRGE